MILADLRVKSDNEVLGAPSVFKSCISIGTWRNSASRVVCRCPGFDRRRLGDDYLTCSQRMAGPALPSTPSPSPPERDNPALYTGYDLDVNPGIAVSAIWAISHTAPIPRPGSQSASIAACSPGSCWERAASAMNQPQGRPIDNESMDPLFQFDPFEASADRRAPTVAPKMQLPPSSAYRYTWSPLILPMFHAEGSSTTRDMSYAYDMYAEASEATMDSKGKAVQSAGPSDAGDDVFSTFNPELS